MILVLNRGLSINSNVTFSNHASEWLTLEFASGGLSVNGDVLLPATDLMIQIDRDLQQALAVL